MSSGPNLAALRSELRTVLAGADRMQDHLRAFVRWVGGDSLEVERLLAEAVASLASGARSSSDVGTLGYVAALGGLDDAARGAMAKGLAWLRGRAWFRPQQAPTLEADGVSALGVALAASALGRAGSEAWLGRLITRSVALPGLPPCERSLFAAAAEVLGVPGRPALDAMAPVARVALAIRGIGPGPSEAERAAAWSQAHRFSGDDLVEATLTLAALDALAEVSLPARLGVAEPADVVRLLEGVHRSMRRWAWDQAPLTQHSRTARWDISNEYHVQDLLWALLAPVFPDLTDEENLPSVGQKNPRADLTIASLGTIVEVKFLRPKATFQSIVSEVAEDASLYRTDPRWTSLVAFVWDDSARTEEHATLVRGLCALPMVVGAVVVPRPRKMTPAPSADPAPGSRTRRGPPGPGVPRGEGTCSIPGDQARPRRGRKAESRVEVQGEAPVGALGFPTRPSSSSEPPRSPPGSGGSRPSRNRP
ncbi:hypothetical protein [Muricoccus radiodurans]|uniref:PD-(D/E)XK nuclease domain-containing protein n=1 Tax=Muricoccus radiodurans TaxID=2231721 RepID=UPI003CF7697A